MSSLILKKGLRHAVITAVTREGLGDGGASQFAQMSDAIRQNAPDCRIELLIHDLQGNIEAVAIILEPGPDVLGHNILTLGQYLAPTCDHYPVGKYLKHDEFGSIKLTALELGFDHVEAGSLVRSSYHAEEQFLAHGTSSLKMLPH